MIWCIKIYIIAYVKTQKNKIYYPLCQTYSPIVVCDILYIIAVAEEEYKSEFLSTKHIPYLAIKTGLWDRATVLYLHRTVYLYIMCVKPILLYSRRL